MKFFELHFNPRKVGTFLKGSQAPDAVFDTFCYEPQNVYERKAGYLFVAAELKNTLPSTEKLLDKLASFLKDRYYASPTASPEVAMKTALRKANEFLQELAKQGEVSWLGNLSAGICGISEKRGRFLANFAKVGQVKLLLIRPGRIVDIGKKLEFSEIEPYPLKVFSNVVSGQLADRDIVAILTQPIFERFGQTGVLKEMAKIEQPWNEKEFGALLKSRSKDFKNLSGVCLFCVLTKDEWAKSREPRISLTFQKKPEKFSLRKTIFAILSGALKKTGLALNHVKQREAKKPKRGGSLVKLHQRLAALSDSLIPEPSTVWRRKNAILVLLLVLLLLLGFLIFR